MSRSKFSSSRDRGRPLRLSFELAIVLSMSKDIGIGITDLALTCGSEQVFDEVRTAVLGSARTGRVNDKGSDREDTSSDVCYVGDTR